MFNSTQCKFSKHLLWAILLPRRTVVSLTNVFWWESWSKRRGLSWNNTEASTYKEAKWIYRIKKWENHFQIEEARVAEMASEGFWGKWWRWRSSVDHPRQRERTAWAESPVWGLQAELLWPLWVLVTDSPCGRELGTGNSGLCWRQPWIKESRASPLFCCWWWAGLRGANPE